MDMSILQQRFTSQQRRELLRLTNDYIEELSDLIPHELEDMFPIWEAAIDLAEDLNILEDYGEELLNDPSRYDRDLFGGA